MRRSPVIVVAATFAASLVLGATVFREPVAWAAQGVSATIVGPLDNNGNVAVHEQGTANVNVTNSSLSVSPGVATVYHTGQLSALAHGGDQRSFGANVNASLIDIQVLRGVGYVQLYRIGPADLVLHRELAAGNLVLPLSQLVPVERIILQCYNTDCTIRYNVVGT